MNIENILDIEKIRELYFDENYVRSRECQFRRVDISGGLREYIEVSEDLSAAIAASVTTIEKKTIPLSEYILKWMYDNHKNYEWLRDQSANYGTFFHTLCAHALRGGEIDNNPDALKEMMKAFYTKYRESGFDFEEGYTWYRLMKRNLKKEILSFFRWAEDYDVKPLAIEYKLMSKKEIGSWCLRGKGFTNCQKCKNKIDINGKCENYLSIRQSAGCLDFVVRAKGEKTGGEWKIVLVDVKSGLNGETYEENEVQLEAYAEMWNESNLDCLIDMIFVFKPHIFDKKTRANKKYYTFENLTGKQDFGRWGNLCENFNMNKKHFKFAPKKRTVTGVYKRGSDVSDEALFEEVDIILDMVMEGRKEILDGGKF